MKARASYYLESDTCSALIKADDISIKKITLLFDDNPIKEICKAESCSIYEFPHKGFIDSLKNYFSGMPVEFDVICDLSGYTPLEKKILGLVKNIPYAETVSYEQIAERAGDKNLKRLVGRTMKKNLFPIVIPCHRVIGKDGRLRGFNADGGVKLKERLINLEKSYKP